MQRDERLLELAPGKMRAGRREAQAVRGHGIGRSTETRSLEMAWEEGGVAYSFNLRRIVEKETNKVAALLLVYVDDPLVLGGQTAQDGLKTDEPSWARFCGYEIKAKDGGLLLRQPSYLEGLAQRHNIVEKRAVPLPNWWKKV